MSRRLLLSALILMAACANEVDESPNKLVKEKADGPCGECLKVGTMYRFTSLKITALTGAEPFLVDSLNTLWGQDITKAELNIVLEVIEVDAKQVKFKMHNGARTVAECEEGVCCAEGVCKGGEFCLLSGLEGEMVQPITDSGLGESAKTGLTVYSGSKESPKNCLPGATIHAIPVEQVIATAGCSGTCEPAAEDKLSGQVVGAIGEAKLKAVCACLEFGKKLSTDACGTLDPAYTTADGTCGGCGEAWKNLGALIPTLNGHDLTYDAKTADGQPAATVTASFDAVRLETNPPFCP